MDLDNINDKILKDNEMDKMFKKYDKLKNKKNDKYKDIDKKMTLYWETNFINLINQYTPSKKKTILIGKIHHYRLLSKKIKIPTINKFLVINELKNDAKQIIRYWLDNKRNDIINGIFPCQYLDLNFLIKKREQIFNSYIKSGYITKTISQINSILHLLNNKKNKNYCLWIAMRDSYNIKTKIYPDKNNFIIAYSDPILALLDSFTWNSKNIINNYNGKQLKLFVETNKSINKLKTYRYLYSVEKNTFIPHEDGKNIKFFSQSPVMIINKEKINNVYKKIIK